MDKKALRDYIRKFKRAMTKEEIETKSEKLGQLFLASPLYKQAKNIYGYLPYNQEVRTTAMLEQAQKDGKRIAVPKILGDTMIFVWLDDLTAVEKGYSGIPEPVDLTPVADDPTALVLMPGMAFDPEGHRCGYGGGFYDKYLASEPDHPTLALCYDFQVLPHLETDDYDIPVDCVLWA